MSKTQYRYFQYFSKAMIRLHHAKAFWTLNLYTWFSSEWWSSLKYFSMQMHSGGPISLFSCSCTLHVHVHNVIYIHVHMGTVYLRLCILIMWYIAQVKKDYQVTIFFFFFFFFFISPWKHRQTSKRQCELICLFVLRFYGPVNPMGSCRARSVYLTTRLLGRLSPLSG